MTGKREVPCSLDVVTPAQAEVHAEFVRPPGPDWAVRGTAHPFNPA